MSAMTAKTAGRLAGALLLCACPPPGPGAMRLIAAVGGADEKSASARPAPRRHGTPLWDAA